MEKYTQITLNEWMSWKEDIRQKLAETAGNFVHIGFRLKQIRDSGMYDGCSDIFEFANREYGLGKSTVSRFIAINEKFSEGGNSLELRAEYRALGSSKLSEMLTLPDADCALITERTTVKEIRALKEFNKQETPEEVIVEDSEDVTQKETADELQLQTTNRQQEPKEGRSAVQYSPLQKCIIDFFRAEEKKEVLNRIMDILSGEVSERGLKEAAELMNPGDYCTHKKGLAFLFLYDWNTGVKYKLMTAPDPIAKTWPEFLEKVQDIYWEAYQEDGSDPWGIFYKKKQPEKVSKNEVKSEHEKSVEIQENQGTEPSVATSQQTLKKPVENVEKEVENQLKKSAPVDEIKGQDNVENHPERLPKNYEKQKPVDEEENTRNWRLIGQAKTIFAELKQNMAQHDYKAALANGRKFVEYLEQMEKEREAE